MNIAVEENNVVLKIDVGSKKIKVACPECNSDNIILEGRCVTCLDCFWSKCNI